jgi:hypothetical protein
MLFLGYLLLFLVVIIIYIHMVNYYKINNEIDFVELYEPLKTDYEKMCKNKLPFTILFENNNHFEEGKNALAPQLLYKKENNDLLINNEQKESAVLCQNYERTAIFINNDNILVKLFPPKSKDYLNKLKTSVWKANILDNIKHLKVELRKNSILIIPPFWHYSFKINKIDDDSKKNKENKQNKENAHNDKDCDSNVKLEHCFYITYSNLLGIYLEKGKTLIDDFFK